ncbi:MAG TPA: hypothetical protein VNU19_07020, partial [Candidatus Acidoferrum sp.]|nr:hypothetical protein [Candidatus Acidoferrum sp.]
GIVDTSLPITTSGPSHQPDPYYVPYLLDGDPFYLSQMYLWNAWNSGNVESAIRSIPTPDYGSLFFSYTAGERTIAWGVSHRSEVAFIAPDVDAEKTYFTYQMNDAIAYFEGSLGITGDANYNTTPPYLAGRTTGDIQVGGGGPNDGVPPPLGNWSNNGCNPTDGTSCGVGFAFSGLGWVPGTVGSFDSQFMLYYLDHSLGRSADLGFQIEPVTTHSGAWLIGLINTSGFPWEIQEEWVPDEPAMPPTAGQLASWPAIAALFQPGFLAAGGTQQANFNGSLGNPESYAAYASAAASELTGLTGGPAAWTWAQSTIQQVIPWGSVAGAAGTTNWLGDPTWDMVPCSPCQTLPPISTSIPASTDPL